MSTITVVSLFFTMPQTIHADENNVESSSKADIVSVSQNIVDNAADISINQEIDADILNTVLDENNVSDNINNSDTAVSRDQRIISMELPTVSENTPSTLNFHIDPHHLILDAALANGDRIEEGQNFFFFNSEGDYDLSHMSDPITINNTGSSPILLSVKIRMSQIDGLYYVDSDKVDNIDEAAIYMAAVDDSENNFSINEDGVISFVKTIDDSYSFKIAGRCSESDKWSSIKAAPAISIKWDIAWQDMGIVEDITNQEEEINDSESIGQIPATDEKPDSEKNENQESQVKNIETPSQETSKKEDEISKEEDVYDAQSGSDTSKPADDGKINNSTNGSINESSNVEKSDNNIPADDNAESQDEIISLPEVTVGIIENITEIQSKLEETPAE